MDSFLNFDPPPFPLAIISQFFLCCSLTPSLSILGINRPPVALSGQSRQRTGKSFPSKKSLPIELPGVFQHVYVFVGAIVCGIEKKCVTLRTETGADQ